MTAMWMLITAATTALVLLTVSPSAAFSLPVDEIEKELDALKLQKIGNGSHSASAAFSSETKVVDVDGHRKEEAKFKHLETTNGKVLKNIEGLLERETDKNKEQFAGAAPLHATTASDAKNMNNNNHTHLHLHVDLPEKNVHETYDNQDGDVNLSRGMQRIPLDVLRHQLTKKSQLGLGVNEELQRVLEEEFERDLEEQVQKEIAKEMQVELEKEWEAELEQEMIARQKREEELLRVLFVSTRVLFSYLTREQQDVALQSIGLQMSRLQEQEALHASTQAKAAEMIVSSLVEDLNESEAGLPPSYLALVGSRAMTSLTGKN